MLSPDSGTYYFMQGNSVSLTVDFKDEADARAHFGEWVKKQGTLDKCFTLVRHIVSVHNVVETAVRKMDEVPKLENMITAQPQDEKRST